MDFQETIDLIYYMYNHPYIIIRKIQPFCLDWWNFLERLMNGVKEYVLNEKEEFVDFFDDNERFVLKYSFSLLPAVMLTETEEKSWEVYKALILLLQNYGQMSEQEDLLELVNTLNLLLQSKDSWQALLIQNESMLIQCQSMLNNSNTPYTLSKRFLTSLLNQEDV